MHLETWWVIKNEMYLSMAGLGKNVYGSKSFLSLQISKGKKSTFLLDICVEYSSKGKKKNWKVLKKLC